MTPEQKKSNLRMALILGLGLVLASIAATFFIGFMVKIIYLSH